MLHRWYVIQHRVEENVQAVSVTFKHLKQFKLEKVFFFCNSAGAYFHVLTPRNNHSLSIDRWREKLGNLFLRKLGNTTPHIFVMVLGNDQFTYIISHHHDPILEITEPILKKFWKSPPEGTQKFPCNSIRKALYHKFHIFPKASELKQNGTQKHTFLLT